jgi:hypothetical protein
MRRALVLTNESARHPFRRSLPPRVTALSRSDSDDDQDWKLFMLSFTAFFVSFYGFIA